MLPCTPGTCLLQPGPSGTIEGNIYARMTFVVDYESASSTVGRRRRRQATSEKGYAAMATEVSVGTGETGVELAPSLAAPAATLPLAVVLAIAMCSAIIIG
jgi:hypothetical protein